MIKFPTITNHGLLSVLNGTIKVLQLLRQKESTHRRLQELGNTLSRGMGTVGGTEGIIDKQIEGSGQLLDKSRLVLGLLLVESSVLEHDNITLLGGIDNLLDFVTDAVGGELDFLSEQLSHALGTGSEGELVLWSVLGAAQVRADSHDGSLALEVFDGGDGRPDTGIIGDLLAIKGNVDVAPNKNLLALKVGLRKILNGFLGVKGEVELGGGREGADAEGGGAGDKGGNSGDGEEGGDGRELHGG